jgi:hypothetical protein
MPFELPGQPGQMNMINLSDMLGKAMGGAPKKRRKLKVIDAATRLIEEEPTNGSIRTTSRASRWPMPRLTALSSSTRSTRSRSATCAAGPSAAKECSATCCR